MAFTKMKKDFEEDLEKDLVLFKFQWPGDDNFLSKSASKALSFLLSCLEKDLFPRSDYRDLCELAVVYLGGEVSWRSSHRFPFHPLGPIHQARFMARGRGYLMLELMKNIYPISEDSRSTVARLSQWIAIFYTPWFMKSYIASISPSTDLTLIKDMINYLEFDSEVASAALNAMRPHVSTATTKKQQKGTAVSLVSQASVDGNQVSGENVDIQVNKSNK